MLNKLLEWFLWAEPQTASNYDKHSMQMFNSQNCVPDFKKKCLSTGKLHQASKAAITRCDLSATILLKLVDSYLIAFKFAQ